MTAIQICALIALIVLAGLLVWTGYFMGHNDGMSAGMKESDAIQRAESAKTIRELKASLEFIKADHARLARFSERLQEGLPLGENERQTLLDIAEKLRIAAETFAAFRTGKKLERDTIELRDRALAMAALLVPATQEDAA
jgi:Tfp pilus assembly protein PilO